MKTELHRHGPHGLVVATVILILATAASCAVFQGQGAEESISEVWVIQWQRMGGIAGFCDEETIYASGTVIVASCRTEPSKVMGEVQLTTEEQATLDGWRTTYRSSTIVQSDPATADGMTITITFEGAGTQVLDDEAFQQMDRLAQQLLARTNR